MMNGGFTILLDFVGGSQRQALVTGGCGIVATVVKSVVFEENRRVLGMAVIDVRACCFVCCCAMFCLFPVSGRELSVLDRLLAGLSRHAKHTQTDTQTGTQNGIHKDVGAFTH